ncbi:RagB/SusD family nutrient uptake outer membrane protein [Deminuibacter soli]|uniref:RagB/SusD family nutrient uptake outer membrane protein n=1 Tax=Deminuibacter soli TaxID=2291815 RepID=A0A3E1NCQ5_9BACT|nr:RagB/SusD family nutrient uptake outer membrane protein [Deminuibacter soli]RFM25720.1 RagB/SusD family nutrient uptake outer membrane protein [Deminuibacter soli]
MYIQLKKQILILLLGFTALVACKKNLDQLPQDTATNAAIFGSVDGMKLYTNSFYNILPDISTPYKTDCDLSDYGARNAVSDFLRSGAYTSRQETGWKWNDLRNINYFIANCNNPAVPQAARENYVGLARFFRAWFYFEKVKRYGDVPWISKPLAVGDSALYSGRTPRAQVMDSVMADLNYACEHISTADDATRSTITKWVAYGYKSRVCLFEGTFRKYQKDFGLSGSAELWLQSASDAAKKVMDSAKLSLNQGGDLAYRNLFISNSPVTSEIMLADVSSSSLAKFNDANWYFTSATYGVRFSFTRTFINTYLTINGTPFTDIAGHDTITFANEVKNRDKRLQQTIRMGDYKRVNSGAPVAAPPVFSYTYTGYQPIKWCLDDTYNDNGTTNTNSISLMRYAEILLNYAEAQAELGKLSAGDWTKTIAALRTRAGISANLGLPAAADTYLQQNYYPEIADAALLEIRRERGIELALEGFRYADLVRWKHGDLLTKQWNGLYVPELNKPMDLNGDGVLDVCFYKGTAPTAVPGVTYVNVSETVGGVTNPQRLSNDTYGELHWLDNVPREWKDYKYLYPVPYNEYQLNPKLGQNPGWN